MVWITRAFPHGVRREGSEVRLDLTTDAPENGCRPAVDPLFRSVAAAYGLGAGSLTAWVRTARRQPRIIIVGQVLVRTRRPASWGMPGAVHRAGMADRVPLAEIAGEIRQSLFGVRRRSPVG